MSRYDEGWYTQLSYLHNRSLRSMHWPEEEERRNNELKAEFRRVCGPLHCLSAWPLYC